MYKCASTEVCASANLYRHMWDVHRRGIFITRFLCPLLFLIPVLIPSFGKVRKDKQLRSDCSYCSCSQHRQIRLLLKCVFVFPSLEEDGPCKQKSFLRKRRDKLWAFSQGEANRHIVTTRKVLFGGAAYCNLIQMKAKCITL